MGDRRYFPDTLGDGVIAQNTGEIGGKRRKLFEVDGSNWLSRSLLHLCA